MKVAPGLADEQARGEKADPGEHGGMRQDDAEGGVVERGEGWTVEQVDDAEREDLAAGEECGDGDEVSEPHGEGGGEDAEQEADAGDDAGDDEAAGELREQLEGGAGPVGGLGEGQTHGEEGDAEGDEEEEGDGPGAAL